MKTQTETPKPTHTCPDCYGQVECWYPDTQGKLRFKMHVKSNGTTCPGSGKAVQKP